MKKNVLLVIGALIFVIALASCKKTVSPEEISKISNDMNQEKVIDILGKPSFSTTDRNELTSKYDSMAMIYITKIEFDESEEDQHRGYAEYSDVYNALENKENVEMFEYKTTVEKNTIYIYFIDDKVSFFYVSDLNSK